MVSDELWIPWSDSLREYYPDDCSDDGDRCARKCTIRNRLDHAPGDWRPVRIPTPRQLEATAELLAALKLVRYPLELEEAIREYESNVAHAAIAKANGESE